MQHSFRLPPEDPVRINRLERF